MDHLIMQEWLDVLDLRVAFEILMQGGYSPVQVRQTIAERRLEDHGVLEDFEAALDALEAWTHGLDQVIVDQNEDIKKLIREAWKMRNVDPDFPAMFTWNRDCLLGELNALEDLQTIVRAFETFVAPDGPTDPYGGDDFDG